MKRYLTYYLIASAVVLLASCTEMVTEVDLPVVEPKLVFNSYISPDDTIVYAVLTKSTPINVSHGWTDPAISDAVVKIYNNGQAVTMNYDFNIGRYTADAALLNMAPGQEYTVTASSAGYDDIDATTAIPAHKNQNVSYVGVHQVHDENMGQDVNRFDVKINDIEGEDNYYRIFLEVCYSADTTFGGFYSIQPADVSPFLSDRNNDGGEILVSFVSSNLDLPYYLRIILYSTDKNYYMYHKSVGNYSEGDPFAEPVQVFSNVNKGLGAFGSYLTYKKLYKLQ